VKYDADIQLIAADEAGVARAVRELAMIGLDAVSAWYPATIVGEWKAAGRPMSTVSHIEAEALAPRVASGEVAVLDVRNRTEFEAGHLPGAIHIPVGYLPERLAEIPLDRPLVVQCQTGARSAIATSVLQKLGVTNAVNLAGGIVAWEQGGHPVAREPSLAEV
jgi:hydroxyacylglutathione hydrolase